MARPTEQRIEKIPVLDDRPRAQGQQVVAHSVDTFVNPGPGNLTSLLEGLATLNPALAQYSKAKQETDELDSQAGERARATGQSKDDSKGDAWARGYMRMDGAVKGLADQQRIQEAYNTGFNRDESDTAGLEAFISKQTGELMKGINDPHFKEGYERSLAPALNKLRGDFAEYHQKQATATMESNAMSLIEAGVRSYTDKGQPVPLEFLENARQRLGREMGVPGARFNDLLFGAVNRLGQEGNFAVYDVLKQKKPDGTPGMYFIPEWKAKIDAAQIHSMTVFNEQKLKAEAAAKRDREERQETALFSVFDRLTSGDDKGARQDFDRLRTSGLFSRASDLVKWEKMFDETSKREARPDQQTAEAELLTGIYTRKQSYNDVVNALHEGRITNTQFKSAMAEARKVIHEDRTTALAAANQDKAIYKTPEFKFGAQYLDDALKSGSSPLDPMGVGTQFDRQLRASAALRFSQEAASAKSPTEVNQIRDRIFQESKKARDEWSNNIKKNPRAAGIRYFTPSAVIEAQKKGLLTPLELEQHVVFFENFNTDSKPKK